MKKVLVVNTVPFSIGGISAVVENYFSKIDPKSVQMDFVVNGFIDDRYRKLFESRGSKIFMTRRKSVLKYVMSLQKIIREGDYEVVHIHGNSRTVTLDLFGAWLGGAKVRIAHSHNTSCNHPIVHRILKVPFELLCNGRLACSESAGYWLFEQKSFTVLRNAIDVGKYRFSKQQRDAVRQKLNLTDDDYVIGHVGYFNEQKNHAFFLKVLKEISESRKNVYALLIGNGPLRQDVEEMALRMGLKDRVIFWGESNDVSSLMCAMDLFLFPSKWEGLGIAMLEAQFSGLPCVASDAVPLETDVVGGNARLSLDAPCSEWASACIERLDLSKDRSCVDAINDWYDIDVQVKNLESFYECGGCAE